MVCFGWHWLGCLLVWWRLWNFSVVQVKFNRFLHLNEPPKRIFWYFVRLFDWWLSKNGNFSFQSQFWRSKFTWIFLKMIFLSEYLIRKTIFISSALNMNHSQGNSFSKIVPNFWGLSIKKSYKITKNTFSTLIEM